MTESTQVAAPTSSMVRVTLVAGKKRADLALPGNLPVAELIPALATSSGLLDAQTSYAGYHLKDRDGRRIDDAETLVSHGVDEGDLLTLDAGVDEPETRVYDDVIEAMGDVVEEQTRPWDPATSRRTALFAAGLLLLVGAVTLAAQRPSLVGGGGAAVAAVLLMAGAVVLEWTRKESRAATMLAAMAIVYAFVSGYTAIENTPVLGLPVGVGAVAALFAGLIAIGALPTHRPLFLPVVVMSTLSIACSALIVVLPLRGAEPFNPFIVGLATGVLAGSIWPWLALSSTKTKVEQVYSTADITKDPEPIDPEQVKADVKIGHDLLLGLTASTALLTILIAPMAVQRGVAGAAMVVCCCLVQLLRTRQYRDGIEVGAGLLGGVLGLLSVAVSILLLQPTWRPYLAGTLALVAAVLLVATLVPLSESVRRGRFGDVAEFVALVAIPPLMVFAIGLVGAVT